MDDGDGGVAAKGASVHVLATPLRRPWRAAIAASRVTRWLRDDAGVEFFLCGRTSAGRGLRNVSRTLSATRVVAVVEWTSSAAAETGRRDVDDRSRGAGAAVWSATLQPLRAHGEWNGQSPFRPDPTASTDGQPVASSTCARVRPRRMVDLYLRSFPALAREACGLTRRWWQDSASAVPLRDACTISFWPGSPDVQGLAFGPSAHGEVQRRSVNEDSRSQSLFARFAVVEHSGTWAGADPLAITQ